MYCPFCSHDDTKVIDKRDIDGLTRRRRECSKCEKRFNTQEEVAEVDLRVVKKDNRRESFSREKLRNGMNKACEKRPVSSEQIDKMIIAVEEKLRAKGKEVPASMIGEFVSNELKKVDKVAYIRFASVYKEFDDISDFKKEIKELG